SSDVGSFPFTIALAQVSVTGDRLEPRSVPHELGAMPGWKLAPLTMPLLETAGAAPVLPPLLTLRTRLFVVSAMNRLPPESSATSVGLLRPALVAGPLSPEKPATPFPATVLMMPSGVTLRMRWLPVSAMYRLPEESTANPACALERFKAALVAAPPSPEKPFVLLPATVLIAPAAVILRIRLSPISAT